MTENYVKSVEMRVKAHHAGLDEQELKALALRQIDIEEQKGSFGYAGLYAIAAGEIERAMTLFEQGNDFIPAARVAKHLGLDEKAVSFYEKAIDDSARNGYFDEALTYIVESGLTDRIEGCYEKVIDHCEKNGYFDEAAKYAAYAAESGFNDRIQACFEKALTHFETKKSFVEAARYARRLGRDEKAAEFYNKAILDKVLSGDGEYGTAARIAKEAGQTERALALSKNDEERERSRYNPTVWEPCMW